jgi:peptidoglycan/xylan/chitin deacetylase (PgdA/CDA1 family)/uncharacterized protein (DUF2062 family)
MVILISIGLIFLLVTWGLLWRNSSLLYETFSRGSNKKNLVALTFDDGPHPELTPLTLDILKKENVKAAFFLVGRFAEKYPELVKRAHDEGHLIANHTYGHEWYLSLLGPARMKEAIVKTGRIIERITGEIPRFYRSPVGIKTPPQIIAAWQMGLKFVGWSRWAIDGSARSLSAKNTEKLIAKTRAGDVFLLHDGKVNFGGKVLHDKTFLAETAQNLPTLIKGIRDRGFEFTTLDVMFNIPCSLKTPIETDPPPGASPRQQLSFLIKSMTLAHKDPFRLSLAVAVGIIIGCSPFFGLHTPCAILAATRLRLNKIAAIIGTNISNPLIAPFIIVASVQIGWRLLHGSWIPLSAIDFNNHSVLEIANNFYLSWLVGFLFVGVSISAMTISIAYLFLRFFKFNIGKSS